MSAPEQVTFARKWELGFAWEKTFVEQEGSQKSTVLFGWCSPHLVRAAMAEFLATLLFLFFVITIARFVPINQEASLGFTGIDKTGETASSIFSIAFGFGLSIFVLVYIFAGVSGANLNPAVSLGLLLGKRISIQRFVLYVIAQVLGAMAGAGIATVFSDETAGGYNSVTPGIMAEDAFGGEVLCTFVLVLTVFAATDGHLTGKLGHIPTLLPLAIGLAVLLAHIVLIPVDGCSINPARSFATSVTNDNWDDHWVFWIGPLVGGGLAPIVWEALLRPEQPVPPPPTTEAKPGTAV